MKLNLLFTFIFAFSFSVFSQSRLQTNDLDPNGNRQPISNKANPIVNSNSVLNPNMPEAFVGHRALTELNVAGQGDSYPWISPNGLRLYYVNGASSATNRLMFTSRPDMDTNFSTPVEVPISPLVDPICYWLTNDELQVYIGTQNGLFYAQRSSLQSNFSIPIAITITGLGAFAVVTGVSLDEDLNSLYIKGGQKYTRTSSTSFAFSYNFEDGSFMEGQISKNNLTFTFAHGDFYSSIIATSTRTSTSENFPSNYQSTGLGTAASKLQPTTSDYMEWYVYVVNSNGSWTGNDLYIARNTTLSNSQFDTINLSIYPNPSNGIFNLDYSGIETSSYTVEIFNSLGQKIKTEPLKNQYDFSNLSRGVYIMKIKADLNSTTKKIIIE